MKYIRTKNYIHNSKDVVVVNENGTLVVLRGVDKDFVERTRGRIWNTGTNVVLAQADTIEELIDEVVLIENGVEHNIVYLQEAYDRIIEYHEQGNHEPRLIGRIKVGLDKEAVAEWKENEQGLYEWVLL